MDRLIDFKFILNIKKDHKKCKNKMFRKHRWNGISSIYNIKSCGQVTSEKLFNINN